MFTKALHFLFKLLCPKTEQIIPEPYRILEFTSRQNLEDVENLKKLRF